MMDDTTRKIPVPVICKKEAAALDSLTKCYEKLTSPGTIAKIATTASQIVPQKLKELCGNVGTSITEQELYTQMLDILAKGFKAIEETAAAVTISEKQIVNRINRRFPRYGISTLSEVCYMRSYDLSKVVSGYRTQDTFLAAIEGAATGIVGFWGLPANLLLSTFLLYRAIQSIAMFYGYNVKEDAAELVIASEVFANALSPMKNDVNNEVTNLISKIMLMSQAAIIKQTTKKTWSDMAARGGVTLLITQMRALANKVAQKALNNVGAKGLENSLFKEVFEQIGRKLTLKSVGKAIPYLSAIFGALIDTAQMKKVLEFADIFYQKRFILEKEDRIMALAEDQFDDIAPSQYIVIDKNDVEKQEIL